MLAKKKDIFNNYTHVAVNDWPIFQMAADKQNTMNTCMDNNIPLVVFGLDNPDNIVKAVLGEQIGTVVCQ